MESGCSPHLTRVCFKGIKRHRGARFDEVALAALSSRCMHLAQVGKLHASHKDQDRNCDAKEPRINTS